jgi:hypothetical protein
VQGVIVVVALFNATAVFSESRAAKLVSQQIREELQGFPDATVVVWGSAFPFEAAYPVLEQKENAVMYKLYGLGVFTFAPFSVAHAEEMAGRGLVSRLVSENGIPIMGADNLFGFLSTYCEEHWSGVLIELASQEYGLRHVSWRRCEAKAGQ